MKMKVKPGWGLLTAGFIAAFLLGIGTEIGSAGAFDGQLFFLAASVCVLALGGFVWFICNFPETNQEEDD